MHSIRSGAAMAMYIPECVVYTIMLIGRWSSDAFLQYIRKQVMEFSQNAAKKMLTYQNFCHIPDIHRRIPRDDPRQHNNPNNAETRRNVGGNMLCQAHLPPAFSLYSQTDSQSKHLDYQMVETHRLLIWDRGRGQIGYQNTNFKPILKILSFMLLYRWSQDKQKHLVPKSFVTWRLMRGVLTRDLFIIVLVPKYYNYSGILVCWS